jgi:hypothetical protein
VLSGAQKVRPGSVRLSTYFSDTALVSPKFDSVVVESKGTSGVGSLGREIRILQSSVVRFNPSRVAAP